MVKEALKTLQDQSNLWVGNTAKQFDSFQPDQLSFDVTSPVVFYSKQAAPDKETLFMVVQRSLMTLFQNTLCKHTMLIFVINADVFYSQLLLIFKKVFFFKAI